MAAETPDGLTAGVPWSSALRVLAARFGDTTAVTDGCEKLSYNELCRRAHALAARLIVAGVGPGKCVATLLPNGTAAVWVCYGIKLTGAAEAPLNWCYTADEIAWSARLADFRIVVTFGVRANELTVSIRTACWCCCAPELSTPSWNGGSMIGLEGKGRRGGAAARASLIEFVQHMARAARQFDVAAAVMNFHAIHPYAVNAL